MIEEIKKRLELWSVDNFLKLKIVDEGDVFYTVEPNEEEVYMLISPKDDKIIDKDICFILDENEIAILSSEKIKYILFEFGGRFYYTKLIPFKNEYNDDGCYEAHFNDFKYIGSSNIQFDTPFVNLGVHSQYELLNGSNDASLWAKKAKFLNQKAIGLCDKNTLGGTLSFQTCCQKEKIKYVIGETVTIAHHFDKEAQLQETNELKLYVKNEIGWQNLLQINKQIKVDNAGFCTEEFLLDHTDGLICVLSANSLLNSIDDIKDGLSFIKKFESKFESVFYQIDSVEYFEDEADIKNITHIQNYLKNYYKVLKPVLINDSYYVEKEMWILKEFINKVSRKVHDDYSRDQYFKTTDETIEKLAALFSDEEKFLGLFEEMCDNTVKIADMCDFEIESKFNKLPVYENIEDPEKDNLDLFFELIENGIEKKLSKKNVDMDLYSARIEKEAEVIINAGIVDYFLILWDIVKWCKENNIYVGPARGSAGGSLIMYLIDVIDIDPILHELSFERFLSPARFLPDIFYELEFDNGKKISYKIGEKIKLSNESEILIENLKEKQEIFEKGIVLKISIIKKSKKGNLPDVDTDFETEHRDTVKQYMRIRFHEEQVCSIGSYTTFQPRGAIKDFAKVRGLDFQKMNFITKVIPNQLEYEFRDVLKYAQKSYELKKFLNENIDIFHAVKYSINQPKSASIHASAVVIVPKTRDDKDANIFNWLPVRQENGLLVSEWEGTYTDIAGFLKEDILGLNQLDKLHSINKLLKKNGKDPVDWALIPLDDKNTFLLFHKGFTEDVFQYATALVKAYVIKVKPTRFEELAAITSLLRPGPMAINAHNDFADYKNLVKKLKYDFGLKSITESTQGLLIYQEQIMAACVLLGGFTLIQAEEVRQIIKKFQRKEMETYEQLFIKGAIERECPEKEAKKIWDKIVVFSSYAFNKSHASAYALLSYRSQWAKANHPLEFWTTALQYASEEDIPQLISELKRLKNGILLKPPSVNHSESAFVCDVDTNSIFWGINKIKGLGEATTPKIIEERNKNGIFKSYDEFKTRFEKKDVNKGKLLVLILAGGFDELEGIKYPEQRFDLIKKHFESYKEELPEQCKIGKTFVNFKSPLVNKRYFWVLIQRTLTGFGIINFQELLNDNLKFKKYAKTVVDSDEFLKLKDYSECTIVGQVLFLNERSSKNGTWLKVTLSSNNEILLLNIWAQDYERNKNVLNEECVGKMLIFSEGKTKFNDHQGFTVFNSTEKTIIGEV